jgi:uncharacterized protein (TIGR02466 family)
MNLHKEEWWPTPVWWYDIVDEVDLRLITKECYDQRQIDFNGNSLSNRHGWQSQSSENLILNPDSEIKKLTKKIEEIAAEIYENFGVIKTKPKHLANFWININSKGSFNVPHVHPGSVISGVCYIKADRLSGNLNLHNRPELEFINRAYTECNNRMTFTEISYSPIQGRIIFFPGWINHSVSENKSDQDRISIAFNF